jgi:acyl-CoA thioesterase I
MKDSKLAIVLSVLGLCAAFTADAQTRILPFGDSVTSSFAPYSSYRYQLYHLLVDHGFSVDFVGTQNGVAGGTPQNTDYDADHEGHPGWQTADGLENIDSILKITRPDIVLLDLGGNDVLGEVATEISSNNLALIIEHIRDANPNMTILIACPTPFEGQDKQQMARLRSAIHHVMMLKNQLNSRIYCINLFGGFSVAKDTFDGSHPDESGEMKIAKRYYKVLKKVLRQSS